MNKLLSKEISNFLLDLGSFTVIIYIKFI